VTPPRRTGKEAQADDDVDGPKVAAVVAGQNFHSRSRHPFVNRAHRVCEDQGAAVRKIVAVDGRHHEILPAQIAHGFCDAQRLEPIDLASRVAGLDVAESAPASAKVA